MDSKATGLRALEARLGEELGASGWVALTQAKFDGFAAVTGDADWLHNDARRCAAESPFGGKTIAQGHLLLAHLSQAAEALMPRPEGLRYALNYGYDRVRVIRPVSVGSRIRVRLRLEEVRRKGEGQYVVKTEAAVEVEGSAGPHLVAEWLFFVQMDVP